MDDYTMALRLCGDDGMVADEHLDTLNRLRRFGGDAPYEGDPFACTGSAHLAGQHIRCTSPAHAVVVGAPLNGWQVTTTMPTAQFV